MTKSDAEFLSNKYRFTKQELYDILKKALNGLPELFPQAGSAAEKELGYEHSSHGMGANPRGYT